MKNRIIIRAPRPDLVQITYRDSDAQRTYKVTERLAAMFIKESLATKDRESREAYEFIDAGRRLPQEAHRRRRQPQQYRAANADAHPGSETDANTRISALRTRSNRPGRR